ncbi:MAG: PAS domain-containing protein [Bacteroidetes bacterium]|nr:PAS domain-containing protein [Bacteroidota bacterium]
MMNKKLISDKELQKEFNLLQEEYNLLNRRSLADIDKLRKTEQSLKDCEDNSHERIKELNGIFLLGQLTEEYNNLEDIYQEFVNNVVPDSMAFPGRLLYLEIDNKKYCNLKNFKIHKTRKILSSPINLFKKPAGELIVTYKENLPFIDFFEQNLIDNYAERISKITERIIVKQTLEESEKKYRTTMSALPDMLFYFDAKGTFLDSQCSKFDTLMLEKELFIGKTLNEVMPAKIAEQGMHAIKKALETDLLQIFEYSIDFPKGKQHFEMRLVKTAPNELLGVARNNTSLKESESVIQHQNSELKKLNTDKDLFITILSHDLKSPLNNLLGLSEVLMEDKSKLNADEIRAIANDINKLTKNTSDLLDELLIWARKQQGIIPFEPHNLSFTDICVEILKTLSQKASAKDISIDYSRLDHLSVFADADMLKIILRNLVSNAIKFTNRNGEIQIIADKDAENVTITVSDNGIGIEPQDLIKLFDISQLATTKGTAKEKGTGLGLLLCKEFVEKHNGKIRAESLPGKGSKFIFTLPVSV